MTTYDTLTYNGAEKSFVDWGFSASSVHGRKVNQGDDEFSATIVSATIAGESASPTFPFEAQVSVRCNRMLSGSSYSGGVIKFQGKRVNQPLRASASGQGVTYKFKGPWYDLSNTQYQQQFKGSSGTVTIAETILFSYVQNYYISGQEYYWGNISAGDQLQLVLEFLLSTYAAQGMSAPFQFAGRKNHGGTVTSTPSNNGAFITWPNAGGTPTISASLYSLYLPSYITKPLMCSDAIEKCLQLSPRASLWFDHSTSPPTLHVTQPEDKRAVTLPLFDGVSHKSVQITRRDDLKVRAVNICYRINTTVAGKTVIDYVNDNVGGLSSGLRVINELVDLQGASISYATAQLDVEPIQAIGYTHAQMRSWWASKRGGEQSKLSDLRIRFQTPSGAATSLPDSIITQTYVDPITLIESEITYTPASLAAAGFCDIYGNPVLNRIIGGTVAPWMTRTDGQPVVSGKFKLTCAAPECREFNFIGSSETDTNGQSVSDKKSHDLHVNVTITNGASGPYSTVQSFTYGEMWITGSGGIAQYLYNYLNSYQYDGEAVHVQASFDGAGASGVDLGCAFNLSGAAAEWASMNAQIQSIEEDYFNHTISVNIGVAKHLNAGQLSSILNMWRNRRTWYNPEIRANEASGNGGIQMPAEVGDINTTEGLSNTASITHIDYSVLPSGSSPGTASASAHINAKDATVNDSLQ